MTVHPRPDTVGTEILDESDAADRRRLAELSADPLVTRLDTVAQQRAELSALIPTPEQALLDETARWVHLPWRRTLVHLLGPESFRRVRLDRNRNKITLEEQRAAAATTIGVVGLSVGHAIAHTIALEGITGTLRLADFDELDLSNLNRVPATVLDLGVDKAVVAARRIAEIDPYLRVEIMAAPVDAETVEDFLEGLDLVLEECDSFAAKFLVRERARLRRIPVVTESSDGGVLDVERFDLEPDRPLFHGLLGDIDPDAVAAAGPAGRIGAAATLLDASRITPRMGASVLEVGRTLSTWPQLGGDVALGGATCAAAIRRLVQGLPLPSGRTRIDIEGALDTLEPPPLPRIPDGGPSPDRVALSDVEAIAAARSRSGNASWTSVVDVDGMSMHVALDHDRPTSRVDVDRRGSAFALGATVRAMIVAAAGRGMSGEAVVDGRDDDPDGSVVWGPSATRGDDGMGGGANAALDTITDLSDDTATVRVVADRAAVERYAAALAVGERIRWLTPDLHAELVTSPPVLPPGAAALLGVLTRADVMAHLSDWDAGQALGDLTRGAVAGSSALVVVTAAGWSAADFARAGIVAETVWARLAATGRDVAAAQPITGYARDDDERRGIAPERGDQLCAADRDARDALGLAPDDAPALVMRVA
ncbi:Rv1355c family protein [Williamsia deligens]|uniref:Rv1355c family protein n=1 Tax=Williamsia deligens TaxID=321325 RepID=A0ABW3GA82_9NOCA|nr:Rv1355c family protein [Williamsia deligens]MCP2195755.1 ThiF family protein [Williamsia deligens]